MDYSIFIRPLIGAAIGYVTNWIAVKMMFRPLNPVKIGKFVLPFTPGIIPKNKPRLAEAIASTVTEDLLAENDLKNYLLSDSLKEKIRKNVIAFCNAQTENDSTLEEIFINLISQESYSSLKDSLVTKLSNSIYDTVLEANLGNLIAEQIENAAKEKLKGSVLGIFGGNAIVSNITSEVSDKINIYIEDNGNEIISGMVSKELDKYASNTVSDIFNEIGNSDIDLVNILLNIYENLVSEKLSVLLSTLNISKMIENKINDMDTLELEKLILFIMKKELNALVNLGALIGLILGLVNLLF